MNTAKQAGGALGLAVLTLVAGSGPSAQDALAVDYQAGFLGMTAALLAVAALALALPPQRDKAKAAETS